MGQPHEDAVFAGFLPRVKQIWCSMRSFKESVGLSGVAGGSAVLVRVALRSLMAPPESVKVMASSRDGEGD
jgi:hypothetical protein